MKLLRSPMIVCSLVLIIAMVLTFTTFWSEKIVGGIPGMNWALTFLNLFSLLIAVVYVFWLRSLELKKEQKKQVLR